jgi:hypothetical protein
MAKVERAIAKWAHIRSKGLGDGFLEVPSVDAGVATGYGSARYAIGPNGEPRLLVPCGDLLLPKAMPSSRNLQISLVRFTIQGRPVRFIDVTSTNRQLDPVFAELADEVLFRLDSGRAPVDAVATTIADFVELLDSGDPERVDASLVLGLLGELLILERLVELDATALEAWVGPFEQRHDIRRGVHAFEVKTSGRSDAKVVHIHGIDQLLEPPGGTLALFHVRLERAQHGSISVASMCDRLVKRGASFNVLSRGLAELGCKDPASTVWNVARYEVEGVKGFSVTDGFPRIVQTSFPAGVLPSGVRDLSYCIDLDSASNWAVPSETLDGDVMRRLIG